MIRCLMKHTNCILVIANTMNAVMRDLLKHFDGRCPDLFCPVKQEQEVCDLQLAYRMFSEFKMSLENGADICR